MIPRTFLENEHYLTFKQMLIDELMLKPVKIKTDGKTNEILARELNAYEIASKSVEKTIRKFERQTLSDVKETSWK